MNSSGPPSVEYDATTGLPVMFILVDGEMQCREAIRFDYGPGIDTYWEPKIDGSREILFRTVDGSMYILSLCPDQQP